MRETASPASVVYFHGLPGSAQELALIGLKQGQGPTVLDPLDFEAFDRHVAQFGPVSVVGFSLGAFSALKIAAERPDGVTDLALISPAGPLELGSSIDQMAGAPVFKMAGATAAGFAMLTAAQGLLAHTSPRLLLNQMFANSCEAERVLLQNSHLVRPLVHGLKHALWRTAPRYRQTVRAYVRPWVDDLAKVRCPCQIYHGDQDNWAPLAMSEALVARLPSSTGLTVEQGLGHYSTLIKSLPNILSEGR